MLWLPIAAGLLLAVLLVPVSVEIAVRTELGLKVEAITRWGGLPAGSWHTGSEKPPARQDRPSGKAAACSPHSRRRSAPNLRKLHALFRSDDFLASLLRWMSRIIRILGPRDVRVHLRFGTGDPCDTGDLWGVLSSLFVLFSRETAGKVELEPDFVDQVFDLDAYAQVRFAPLTLFLTSLGFFLTPAPWRALRNYMRA